MSSIAVFAFILAVLVVIHSCAVSKHVSIQVERLFSKLNLFMFELFVLLAILKTDDVFFVIDYL